MPGPLSKIPAMLSLFKYRIMVGGFRFFYKTDLELFMFWICGKHFLMSYMICVLCWWLNFCFCLVRLSFDASSICSFVHVVV